MKAIRPSEEVIRENIKKWNIPQPDRQYTILIHCSTYNHGKYIKEALEGFVIQKCTYTFCAIIIDDFSTDNNAEIIREYAERYPDIIKPILLGENHMQHGILRDPYFEKWHQCAKYIAFCEGDDFWIDPLKLQKQVDFMEANPDYTLCYTKYYSYHEASKKILSIGGVEYPTIYEMLWKDVNIASPTVCYRKSAFDGYKDFIKEESDKWLMGDKPLFFWFGSKGKTKLLPDITAYYRILENSASHSQNIDLQLKRARNTIDIYHFFAEKFYPNDIKLKNKIEGGYLYRAYLYYKELSIPYPDELKKDIINYKGDYKKLSVVKVLLRFPFLEGITYKMARMKQILKKEMDNYV